MDDISRYFEDLGLDSSLTISSPVSGGHMSYGKTIYINDSEKIFVKKFVSKSDLTELQSSHALAYLVKEHSVINQLSQLDIVPEHSELIGQSLILPAYMVDYGWYWSAPSDTELQQKYIEDILDALQQKESQAVNIDTSVIAPSQKTLEQNGWQKLMNTPSLSSRVKKLLDKFSSDLHPDTLKVGNNLLDNIDNLMKQYRSIEPKDLTSFSHHDARQHNIAWHPDLGVCIVDWSWAGMGLPGSDTTMFLVDLAKSSVNASNYLDEYFNPVHAHTLLGYWLARSLEKPNISNPEVRLHQLASALTACRLLIK